MANAVISWANDNFRELSKFVQVEFPGTATYTFKAGSLIAFRLNAAATRLDVGLVGGQELVLENVDNLVEVRDELVKLAGLVADPVRVPSK